MRSRSLRFSLLGFFIAPLAVLALVHCSDDSSGAGATFDASAPRFDASTSDVATNARDSGSGEGQDSSVDAGPVYDDAGCVYEPGPAPRIADQQIATNGLALWLSAEYGVATTDAGAVCHWDDLSGTGAQFRPTATAPTLANGALRNKKAVAFVGQEALSRDDLLGIAPTAGRTVAVFGAVADTGRRFHYFIQGQSNTAGTYFGLDQNTYQTTGTREGVYVTNNAYDSNVTTNGAPHAHVFSISSFAAGGGLPGVLFYAVDGTPTTLTRTPGGLGTSVVESFADANFTAIGAADDPGFTGAYIAEVLVWNRALDAAERAMVGAHLRPAIRNDAEAAMTLLRLATASEGRDVLAAEDDFTRALGGFDRSFRMRTTAPIDDVALRRYLGEQAVDFTSGEASAWEQAMATVARGLRGLGYLLPPEVLVVKTTGHEERGHAYTRANAIVLPAARVQHLRGERAFRLLAHEIFHVASRASMALRDATYALLGFAPVGPIIPPPELDDSRMTNPDAHALGHYVRLEGRAVVPLLTCPLPLAEVLERPSVLGLVRTTLLEIDPDAGTILRDAGGAPVLVDPEAAGWSERIGRNSMYTIHPEEVLADNLSWVVRRCLGETEAPADPAFLDAFEETVRSV